MKYKMACPYFPENEIELIMEEFKSILNGENLLSMGKNVAEFENEFADYIGSEFAVGTNSCSAALEISLRTANLLPGDEVIVPVETFFATGAAVVREGGHPIFAEVDPDTFCLSLNSVKEKITRKTKAIIIVHMAGMISPDIINLKDLCESEKIVLIEDAAHALGASINGVKAGNLGDIACFSFFPTKMITTAEGGMIITSDEQRFVRANSYRNRGLDMNAEVERYSGIGTNNRMSEIAAIMGRSQLRCINEFLLKRNNAASIYNEVIETFNLKELCKPIKPSKEIKHSYWRYLVLLRDEINREEIKKRMAEDGISVDWAYYPALHLQPVFVKMYGNKKGMLPVSEDLLDHNICLPMHSQIDESDAVFIAERFKKHILDIS